MINLQKLLDLNTKVIHDTELIKVKQNVNNNINQIKLDKNKAIKCDNTVKYKFTNISLSKSFIDNLNYCKVDNVFDKDNLVSDYMLELIGNSNRSVRKGILRKVTSSYKKDSRYSYEEKYYTNNTLMKGFNKSDDGYQKPVSYKINDNNFIGNFENLDYQHRMTHVTRFQLELAKELEYNEDKVRINISNSDETKLMDLLKGCKRKLVVDIIKDLINMIKVDSKRDIKQFDIPIYLPEDCNTAIDALIYLLRTTKVNAHTDLTKVVTLDLDLVPDSFGTLQKYAIFKECLKYNCFIVENKEENGYEKRNHFTIIFILRTLYHTENAKQIRNKFKIAGMCDPNHNTFSGKNIFNTNKFNVYYNPFGKYVDMVDDGMVDECINKQQGIFEFTKIDETETINDMYDKMFKTKYKHHSASFCDFTDTDMFKEFAISQKCKIEVEKEYKEDNSEENIKIRKESKKNYENCKNLDKLFEDINKNITDLNEINYKIVLKDFNRKLNCSKFGYILRSTYKFDISRKEAIELFHKLVIIEEPDNKHSEEELLKSMLSGYQFGEIAISKYEDFIDEQSVRGTFGSFVTNSNRTKNIELEIIKDILDYIKNGVKLNKIKRLVKKKRRNYDEFITKIVDTLYFCNTLDEEEIKNKLIFEANEWLHERTINNGKTHCHNKDIRTKKILEKEQEIVNDMKEQIKKLDFKAVVKLIKKLICKKVNNIKDIDAFLLIKEFRNNVRKLLTRKRWCLVE